MAPEVPNKKGEDIMKKLIIMLSLKSIFVTTLAIALICGFSHGDEGGDNAPATENEGKAEEGYQGKGLDGEYAVETIKRYRGSFKEKEASQQKTIDVKPKHQGAVGPSGKYYPGVKEGVVGEGGEFYPGVGSGAINPKTGEFYPGVGPGAINPKTGEFYPDASPPDDE